ncbi:MAG: hypothetical protein QW063_01485 [Candidatus Nanoarchaeia archaeon]
MKAYLTWGVGYGKSRELAEANAQADANLDKIKINKLKKLEIPRCKIIEDKKQLTKLKGNFFGIVLQNCQKGEVAAALVLGITADKIVIGHGKAGGAIKAERIANIEMRKVIEKQELKFEGINYHIVADAPAKKDIYSCAIVALVLEE